MATWRCRRPNSPHLVWDKYQRVETQGSIAGRIGQSRNRHVANDEACPLSEAKTHCLLAGESDANRRDINADQARSGLYRNPQSGSAVTATQIDQSASGREVHCGEQALKC